MLFWHGFASKSGRLTRWAWRDKGHKVPGVIFSTIDCMLLLTVLAQCYLNKPLVISIKIWCIICPALFELWVWLIIQIVRLVEILFGWWLKKSAFLWCRTRGVSRDIAVTWRWTNKEPLRDHPRTVVLNFAQVKTTFLVLCLKKFTVLCVKRSDKRIWGIFHGNVGIIKFFTHSNTPILFSQSDKQIFCLLVL